MINMSTLLLTRKRMALPIPTDIDSRVVPKLRGKAVTLGPGAGRAGLACPLPDVMRNAIDPSCTAICDTKVHRAPLDLALRQSPQMQITVEPSGALRQTSAGSVQILKRSMKKLRFLVSLTTDDNDYQIEQAVNAEETARKLGAAVEVVYAGNDAINQSQQLLKIIQAGKESRPDAIVFEPAGSTGLPQVARAAATAGIGWVILNRDAEYIGELRSAYEVPVFCLTSDHEEIGRVQGKQIGALVPASGSILYIQGPAGSDAAQQRTEGMQKTKPGSIQARMVRAQWTEGSAHQAVSAWLRLSTSRGLHLDAIVAQDDSMAMGARKAFQEITNLEQRDRWLSRPFTGCDGMPKTGQAWVRSGLLAATVVIPANAGLALEMLAKALHSGVRPAERTATEVRSYPTIEELTIRHGQPRQ